MLLLFSNFPVLDILDSLVTLSATCTAQLSLDILQKSYRSWRLSSILISRISGRQVPNMFPSHVSNIELIKFYFFKKKYYIEKTRK
jgi:hypothetical protein